MENTIDENIKIRFTIPLCTKIKKFNIQSSVTFIVK